MREPGAVMIMLGAGCVLMAGCGGGAPRAGEAPRRAPAPAVRADEVQTSAAVPSAPAPAAGPERERRCTLMEFMDGLFVQLVRHGEWPAGRYRFAIRYEGETMTCEGRFPLGPPGTSVGIECDPDATVINDPGLLQILIFSHPQLVEIVVTRGGTRVAQVRQELEYSESEPNGPGCGLVRVAAVEVSLPGAR